MLSALPPCALIPVHVCVAGSALTNMDSFLKTKPKHFIRHCAEKRFLGALGKSLNASICSDITVVPVVPDFTKSCGPCAEIPYAFKLVSPPV